MPDQVKLEPPPGQDVIRAVGGSLYLHLPGYLTEWILSLEEQPHMIAACIGAEMWRQEARRISITTLEGCRRASHAAKQCHAWERWGGLT